MSSHLQHCRGDHCTVHTNTFGTAYNKADCPNCKSYVLVEKDERGLGRCICCKGAVKHKNHYRKLKSILNKAVKENSGLIDTMKLQTIQNNLIVKVEFGDQEYHISIKGIIMYNSNQYTRDTMPAIQDEVVLVRKTKTGRKTI
ncbi:hypothetical protein OAJ50_04505 [Candidatus Nitrosopelagicus sp.]|nr:hypothetical protein [Candidatus Nitrosopelagicus sp.]